MGTKVLPCRKCMKEAIVEPTASGYKIECVQCPDKHQVGPFKSRNRAIEVWNARQRANDGAEE